MHGFPSGGRGGSGPSMHPMRAMLLLSLNLINWLIGHFQLLILLPKYSSAPQLFLNHLLADDCYCTWCNFPWLMHQYRMDELRMKEENERKQYQMYEAEVNRRRHLPFLKDSLGKIYRMEEWQRQTGAEHLQTRIKSVLALKCDIDANKVN